MFKAVGRISAVVIIALLSFGCNKEGAPNGSAPTDVSGCIPDTQKEVNIPGSDCHKQKKGKHCKHRHHKDRKCPHDTIPVEPVPVEPEIGGLVAYYPLDGDGADASGNGHNGTVIGATATADRFGTAASAMAFGGDDYIEVAHDPALDLEQALSVTVWAKSSIPGTQYTADGILLQKGFASEEAYDLTYHMSTRSMIGRYRNHWVCDPVCRDLDGGIHDYEVALDTAWHFYAITFDGDSLRLYRDATLVGTIVTYAGSLTDYPLRIGAQSKSVARFWRGGIDEVRIYNRALSAEELAVVSRQ